MMPLPLDVDTAAVVLPCQELHQTLAFFTGLGFRIEQIHPAEDPSVVVLSGHGTRLRLERGADLAPGLLRLACRNVGAFTHGATELTAPNGTRIRLVDAAAPVVVPALRSSFVVSKAENASWVEGRAGMRYRDLIPGRQGGRFIASLIQIPDGGPVADCVHFHAVRFQIIYCAKGWVRVVYEDQGAPFVLSAGDCVLQPPRIRHRVLEASPGLEVVEIGCPAQHETHMDHQLPLPTQAVRTDRDFEGQRFVLHRAESATWAPWVGATEARDLGIETATGGLVTARVIRGKGGDASNPRTHHGELAFAFLLGGSLTLVGQGRSRQRLAQGDAFVVPGETACALEYGEGGAEWLEVTVPGSASTSA